MAESACILQLGRTLWLLILSRAVRATAMHAQNPVVVCTEAIRGGLDLTTETHHKRLDTSLQPLKLTVIASLYALRKRTVIIPNDQHLTGCRPGLTTLPSPWHRLLGAPLDSRLAVRHFEPRACPNRLNPSVSPDPPDLPDLRHSRESMTQWGLTWGSEKKVHKRASWRVTCRIHQEKSTGNSVSSRTNMCRHMRRR
jgi:hypothetical protein